MTLLDALEAFTSDVINLIESITYCEEDNFEIEIYVTNRDEDYQKATVYLYDSGETGLFIDKPEDYSSIIVFDELVDAYIRIRSQWKHEIDFRKVVNDVNEDE